jgi:hypothetical protein
MRRLNYILLAAVMFLACVSLGIGCIATASHTVEMAQFRAPYRVEASMEGLDRTLAPRSPGAQAVAAWLAAHEGGWSPSLITYAPGRVVRGEGFNLNLLPGGLCVLNYGPIGSPAWQQVVRRVSAAEAEELAAATRRE